MGVLLTAGPGRHQGVFVVLMAGGAVGGEDEVSGSIGARSPSMTMRAPLPVSPNRRTDMEWAWTGVLSPGKSIWYTTAIAGWHPPPTG